MNHRHGNDPRHAQRAGSWSVTQHAVERYIERFKPELSLLSARAEIEDALPTATLMREHTSSGQQRWLIRALEIVAIVKPAAPNRVVVTIEPEQRENNLTEVEAELVADYAARAGSMTIDAHAFNPPKPKEKTPKPEPKPKKPKAPPPPKAKAPSYEPPYITEARNLQRRLHLAQAESAIVRQREKTERHRLNNEIQNITLKEALRIAVRSVVKNNDEEAAAQIRAIDAGFLSDGFLAPRKGTA